MPDPPPAAPSPDVAPDSLIDVATLALRLDERGRLHVVRAGGDELHVVARRAFPWSMPDRFITLRDPAGVEVLLIESPDLLPPAARATLGAFLAASTFMPRITRIDHIDLGRHGHQVWRVDTESGPLELRVQEREDIRFLTARRFGVKDANGNVYEIADAEALDPHSRRELARVI